MGGGIFRIVEGRAHPFPSLLGKVAPQGVERRPSSTGYGAGWGVARCFAASRIARPAPEAFSEPVLLSAPHPALRATFPASRGRGSALGLAALGLAVALGGCNPAGYPACFRAECPYPPVHSASYAGYVPAYAPGRPAFGADLWDDPFADYTQRILTISPDAGNSHAANTALQTATPWPRYSGNPNIPGNGTRMVSAVHDYETGKRPALGGGGGGMSGGGGAIGGGQ